MAEANKLTGVEVDEISLVTTPANQYAEVMLFKSHHQEVAMSDNTQVQEGEGIDKSALPAEAVEYINSLEAVSKRLSEQVVHLSDEIAKGGYGKEKMKMDEEDEEEDEEDEMEKLLKSAGPEIVAIVKRAEERAVVAERIAKAERDIRETAELAKIAETKMAGLPATSDDLGKLLKSFSDHLPQEVATHVTDILTKASAMITEGNSVLHEIGKSSRSEAHSTTATTALEKAAAALRAQDGSLSKEMSIVKALDENPELYKQHVAEGGE